jgi:hypothetical protein
MTYIPADLVRRWNSTGLLDHPPRPNGRRFAPEWERYAVYSMENQRLSNENMFPVPDEDHVARWKRCMIQMLPMFLSNIHKYKLVEVYTQISQSSLSIDTGVKPLWLTKPAELPESGFDLCWEEGCIRATEHIVFDWYRQYARSERLAKIGFVCFDMDWSKGTLLFKYFDLIKDVE